MHPDSCSEVSQLLEPWSGVRWVLMCLLPLWDSHRLLTVHTEVPILQGGHFISAFSLRGTAPLAVRVCTVVLPLASFSFLGQRRLMIS